MVGQVSSLLIYNTIVLGNNKKHNEQLQNRDSERNWNGVTLGQIQTLVLIHLMLPLSKVKIAKVFLMMEMRKEN